VNVRTVIDPATDRESVAVTETFVSGVGEKARQTSVVPAWPFPRTTKTHVTPAPATELTVVVPLEGPSVAINASSSSLPAPVENAGDAIVVLDVERAVTLLASTAIAAVAVAEPNKVISAAIA
jgi:hypothetical protein